LQHTLSICLKHFAL